MGGINRDRSGRSAVIVSSSLCLVSTQAAQKGPGKNIAHLPVSVLGLPDNAKALVSSKLL